jgi:hypothetical protein
MYLVQHHTTYGIGFLTLRLQMYACRCRRDNFRWEMDGDAGRYWEAPVTLDISG